MKLKQYLPGTRPAGKPVVSITQNGVIRFNRAFSECAGLSIGDKVGIFQDEENPKDWYIKKDDKAGFILRHGGNSKTLVFNATATAVAIMASLEMTGGINCKMSIEPVDGYYAIITASAMSNIRGQYKQQIPKEL